MAVRGVEFAHVSFEAPGGQRILRDISLRVAPGEVIALLGRSGSGKTTLLRTINALVRPTAGRVLVGGEDIATKDVVALRRSIGYVIQEAGLFPHRRIASNVGMPLEIAGAKRDQAEYQQRVKTAMEMTGLPFDIFSNRFPRELSGGQRQRAGVARALVNAPDILLMDEPFGALDPLTRAEIQSMLRALLRRLGTTTLIVTHDLDEALLLADRIVLIEQGSIAAVVPVAEVATTDNEAMLAYMRAARHEETA